MRQFNRIISIPIWESAKKYLFNMIWLFLEKIVQVFSGLLLGIIIARYLGPSNLGKIAFSVSFAGLFIPIANLGLENIVIRELINNKSNNILGSAFLLRLFGSLIAIGLILITCKALDLTQSQLVLILAVAFSTIFNSFYVINYYFQSKVLGKNIVIPSIISLGISAVIKIILLTLRAPYQYFVWALLIDSITLAIGLAVSYTKSGKSLSRWKVNRVIVVNLLKESWPLIISGVAVSIYMKIDQVMIKIILSDEAVGQYAAAVRLSEAWYFIPAIILSTLFPAIISIKSIDEKKYYERLQYLFNMMALLAIIIAIPTTLLSARIVDFLYGDAYYLTASVLRIHIWAGLFVFIGGSVSKWLIAENLQLYSMIVSIMGAIINVILNIILIKHYGIVGAAWATLIAYSVAAYFALALFSKTRIMFSKLTKAISLTWIYYGNNEKEQ